MKKYRILKDTPELKAGTVSNNYAVEGFVYFDTTDYPKGNTYGFHIDLVKSKPDWFAEVEEEMTLSQKYDNYFNVERIGKQPSLTQELSKLANKMAKSAVEKSLKSYPGVTFQGLKEIIHKELDERLR